MAQQSVRLCLMLILTAAFSYGLLINVPEASAVQAVNRYRRAQVAELRRLEGTSAYLELAETLGSLGYKGQVLFDSQEDEYLAQFIKAHESEQIRGVYTTRLAPGAGLPQVQVIGFEYKVQHMSAESEDWISHEPVHLFGSLGPNPLTDYFPPSEQTAPWAAYYESRDLGTLLLHIPVLVRTRPPGAHVFLVPQSDVDLQPAIVETLSVDGEFFQGRTEQEGLVVDGTERAYQLVVICGAHRANRPLRLSTNPLPGDQQISIPGATPKNCTTL